MRLFYKPRTPSNMTFVNHVGLIPQLPIDKDITVHKCDLFARQPNYALYETVAGSLNASKDYDVRSPGHCEPVSYSLDQDILTIFNKRGHTGPFCTKQPHNA